MLVNNAGFGKCGDFFTSNRASQMGMVDVNCRALTAITRLCLPYMLDDSLVINVASIAAFAPTPPDVGVLRHQGLCAGPFQGPSR